MITELPGNHGTDAANGFLHRLGLLVQRLLLFAQFFGSAHRDCRFLRRGHQPVFLGQALHRAAGLCQHRVVTGAGFGGVVGVVGQQDVGTCRDDQQRPERGHGDPCRSGKGSGDGGQGDGGAGHAGHGPGHPFDSQAVGEDGGAPDVERLHQF